MTDKIQDLSDHELDSQRDTRLTEMLAWKETIAKYVELDDEFAGKIREKERAILTLRCEVADLKNDREVNASQLKDAKRQEEIARINHTRLKDEWWRRNRH